MAGPTNNPPDKYTFWFQGQCYTAVVTGRKNQDETVSEEGLKRNSEFRKESAKATEDFEPAKSLWLNLRQQETIEGQSLAIKELQRERLELMGLNQQLCKEKAALEARMNNVRVYLKAAASYAQNPPC